MNKVTEETNNVALYEKYIQKLNVQEERKAATPLNARWFIRQGYVQNRNHLLAQDVLDLARKIA